MLGCLVQVPGLHKHWRREHPLWEPSWVGLNQKRMNHSQATGLVRIPPLTCESLATKQSNVPAFLSLLACEPNPGEFSGKMLECKTFHYQIFNLGQTNSGVTLISKARTRSQNTDLWFLVTNMILFRPNLCKSTCFWQGPALHALQDQLASVGSGHTLNGLLELDQSLQRKREFNIWTKPTKHICLGKQCNFHQNQ